MDSQSTRAIDVTISLLLLLAVWQFIVWVTGVPSFILPGPLAVFDALVQNFVLILEHAYPARSVQLDVWRVTRYDGEPEGLEGQPLRWVAPADLRTLGLLPADGPIVEALLAHT